MFVVACVWAHEDWGFWLFALPCFLFVSLFGGVPAGFIIWACTRSGAKPLRGAARCAIALLVVFPGWFYFSWIEMYAGPAERLWLLGWLIVAAVTIGLLTQSRLHVGPELVRGGDAVTPGSRVLAGLSGVVLRVSVVLLFMESVVATISFVKTTNQQDELRWVMLICAHFGTSLFVVFLRSNIAVLTALSLIALAPLVIVFVKLPQMTETIRYVFGGYFALWAIFLITRWRETDNAVAFLNEEIHYYLID
jgi:hypothetical protein